MSKCGSKKDGTKCACGMPLSKDTECSCEPGVCVYCCSCGPDCTCGCAEKKKQAK